MTRYVPSLDDSTGRDGYAPLNIPIPVFQTKNAAAIMRVLHYPPQTGPVDDRVIGIGAHTE